MLTRCPACNTRFRIRARHLVAARGRVRCGACGEAFDAIEHLFDDEEPPAPATGAVSGSGRTTGTRAPLSGVDRDRSLDELDLPQGLRGREPEAKDEAMAATFPGTFATAARSPDDSLDEEIEQEPGGHRWIWATAAAVLLLLVAGQVVWFQRDRVASEFPATRPLLEALCQQLDCEVYRRVAPPAYELLARDVRPHPVYEDVLLVNATFVNRADRRQPYPDLELALYDTSGRVQAYRRFVPADYLDESLPAVAGVAPDTPLHVVLEVSGPTEGAVSFEFRLL